MTLHERMHSELVSSILDALEASHLEQKCKIEALTVVAVTTMHMHGIGEKEGLLLVSMLYKALSESIDTKPRLRIVAKEGVLL